MDVLAIDTHSRDLPADAAAGAVRAGVARIVKDRLPFKKIDSTLRGNVAAEIAAALQASGRSCALVAPSAPAHGRVLRGGYLFVHGQQVGAQSLQDMLRGALPGMAVRSLREGETIGAERCVLVADAENAQDLARVAAFGLAHSERVLLAGSSGLASALAERARTGVRPQRPTYDRLLIVVGSHHARSAEQVRALRAERAAATFVLAGHGRLREVDGSLGNAQVLLLHVDGLGAPPELERRGVSTQLAAAAADLLSAHAGSETALLLTGGDTARAVLSRLRVEELAVLGSLDPGIVHGRASVDGRAVGVVTKAGGFGSPGVWVRSAADLLGQSEPVWRRAPGPAARAPGA